MSVQTRSAKEQQPNGTPPAAPAPFSDLRQALVELLQALESEAGALVSNDATALERLAVEKQGRLDAVEWALPNDADSLPADLLEALRDCRTRNRDNAEAVSTRLSITRDTLSRIGWLVGVERSVVYESDGTLVNSRRGRHLGAL